MAGIKRSARRKGHRLSQLLYGLSLVCLAFGLFSLGWTVWPPPSDAVHIAIPAGALPGAPEGTAFCSLSEYAINVSWPRWLRRGESGVIYLHLTDLTQEQEGASAVRAAQIVLVETALYQLQVEPPGQVQANLGDDQDLALTWEVAGEERGAFPGKVYVSFGFFDDALSALVAVPVAVVDIDVQVVELWGLDSRLVTWFGLVGLLLWGVLFVLGRVAADRK